MQVFAWGRGQNGELGRGESVPKSNLPTKIELAPDSGPAQGIACGHFHTLVVTEGHLFACGGGLGGQLGHGDITNSLSLVEVVQLRGKEVVCIAGARTMSAGVLKDKGGIHTWGKVSDGQLGHGDSSDQLEPRALGNISHRPFVAVACGENHSLALSKDNRVYGWGRGHNFRLFGTAWKKGEGQISAPTALELLKKLKVVKVACGHHHSIVLDSDGHVHTAGFNFYGQLGCGTTSPCSEVHSIPSLEREVVVDIAAGAHHTLLLTETGEVFAFGCNFNGELGTGMDSAELAYSTTPLLVSALMGRKVVRIACGAHHSAAVCDDGSLFCWGSNAYGQLGLPSYVSMEEPQCVMRLPDGAKVRNVSCGSFHTAALVELP